MEGALWVVMKQSLETTGYKKSWGLCVGLNERAQKTFKEATKETGALRRWTVALWGQKRFRCYLVDLKPEVAWFMGGFVQGCRACPNGLGFGGDGGTVGHDVQVLC